MYVVMRVAGLARIKSFQSFSDDSITSQCVSSKKNTGLVIYKTGCHVYVMSDITPRIMHRGAFIYIAIAGMSESIVGTKALTFTQLNLLYVLLLLWKSRVQVSQLGRMEGRTKLHSCGFAPYTLYWRSKKFL